MGDAESRAGECEREGCSEPLYRATRFCRTHAAEALLPAESDARRVQIHKAQTGLSISLDGRDIAAFSWVPGMSEEAQDAAVLAYAEQVQAALIDGETDG